MCHEDLALTKFTFCQQSAIFGVIFISEQIVIFPTRLTDFNSRDRKCIQHSKSRIFNKATL